MAAMSIMHDMAYGMAALVTAPVWGFRMLATGKWRTDWAQRFGRTHLEPVDRPTVLIHAVSVGEVNATRKLVERFTAEYRDQIRLVISVSTNTGIARARQLYETRHEVVRYPFDFSCAVGRFLDAVQPDIVALMELEIWPNFVEACAARRIPVAVINGRLSARSFKGYRRFRALLRGMFARLSAVGAQSAAYAERFIAMGVPEDRVEVTGTMKWDTARLTDHLEGSEELASALGIDRDKPLIVCGCTGPGEEALFVEKLSDLTDPDGRPVQLLITPRKPERFEEAARAMGQPIRRSQHPGPDPRQPDDRRLFLLDTMGELGKAYALADVVIVGRSFSPQWGSDMMEPIALGKPTIIGPNTCDFADMMDALLTGDGIVQLDSAESLAQTVKELLHTERGRELARNGRQVIQQQQGATERHFRMIDTLMKSKLAADQP